MPRNRLTQSASLARIFASVNLFVSTPSIYDSAKQKARAKPKMMKREHWVYFEKRGKLKICENAKVSNSA